MFDASSCCLYAVTNRKVFRVFPGGNGSARSLETAPCVDTCKIYFLIVRVDDNQINGVLSGK